MGKVSELEAKLASQDVTPHMKVVRGKVVKVRGYDRDVPLDSLMAGEEVMVHHWFRSAGGRKHKGSFKGKYVKTDGDYAVFQGDTPRRIHVKDIDKLMSQARQGPSHLQKKPKRKPLNPPPLYD